MHRPLIIALTASLLLVLVGKNVRAQSLPEQVARLERELAALKEQVKRIAATSDQQGPQGKEGPPGPRGEPGPPATLGGKLELRGSTGNPAVEMRVDPTNSGEVFFRNGSKKEVVYLGTLTKVLSGLMLLKDSTGKEAVAISANDSGSYASFRNRDGKETAYIGNNSSNASGLIYISYPTGELAAGIFAPAGGSFAKFYNNTGKEVSYIGVATDGSGVLTLNGEFVKDYAEIFELATRQGVVPGTVMAVAGTETRIAPSTASYERRVVGVISGAAGLRSGTVIGSREDGTNDLPLAVSGQVYVRVCLEGGSIEPGDLLVASSQQGIAMRAADLDQATGAVVGKALEAFGPGHGKEGLVRMMVMLR